MRRSRWTQNSSKLKLKTENLERTETLRQRLERPVLFTFHFSVSSFSGALAGVMAHVPGRDDEDDVLGDVRGVVADALEVARHENQIERRLDRRRVLQHVGEQLAEDLRLEGVQLVV